jgi:hypothetical protein
MKAETELTKSMTGPDAAEYNRLKGETDGLDPNSPEYRKKRKRMDELNDRMRGGTPPAGSAPGGAVDGSTAPADAPAAVSPEQAAEDAADPELTDLTTRLGIEGGPAAMNGTNAAAGVIKNAAPAKPGERVAPALTDAELDRVSDYAFKSAPSERPTGFRDAPHFQWGVEQEMRTIGDPKTTPAQKATARKRVRELTKWVHTRKSGSSSNGPTVDGYTWKYKKIDRLGGGSTHQWGWEKDKK